jgi:hypothetical protein
MKWTEVNENNKPCFKKQYLLGRAKQSVFKPERVYFGRLDEIKRTEKGELYIYAIEKRKKWGAVHFKRTHDITHYIEIDNLPQVT